MTETVRPRARSVPHPDPAQVPGPRRNWKSFVLPTGMLVVALAVALTSSLARQDGRFFVAGFLALLSLLLALISGVLLIPRLLSRIRLEFLRNLRVVRLTRRGAAFVVMVLILALASINTGNNLLILILSLLLASLIVSGMVSNLTLHGLKMDLTIPEEIHACQNAVFLISLRNVKRFFPSFALRLTSGEPNRGGVAPAVAVQEKSFPYLKPGQQLQAETHCRFQKRGIFPIESFQVRTTFPFGFFSRGRRLVGQSSIVVYPELRPLEGLFRRYPRLLGSRELLLKGGGSGLYNIRPYCGGDSTRFVDWKATAKMDSLMVRDFVIEEEVPLKLVFWTRLPGGEGRVQFERAVSLVASLGRYFREGRHPFSFYSEDVSIHVNGDSSDYQSLMEYLACVQPSESREARAPADLSDAIVFAAGTPPFPRAGLVVDYLKLQD